MIALLTASLTASATLATVAGPQPLWRASERAAWRARRTAAGLVGSSSSPRSADRLLSATPASVGPGSVSAAMPSVFPAAADNAPRNRSPARSGHLRGDHRRAAGGLWAPGEEGEADGAAGQRDRGDDPGGALVRVHDGRRRAGGAEDRDE